MATNKPEAIIVKLKVQKTDGSIEDAILYCHQETVTIGVAVYHQLKKEIPADAAGTTLSVDGSSTGAKKWDQLAFPLTGILKILGCTINAVYRVSANNTTNVYNGRIDIYIMYAGGGTRQTIVSGASPTTSITGSTTWATYTGADYSFAEYTVVDPTDWLGIDFFCNVTTKKAGGLIYLRIDDNTLALADQTRITGWRFALGRTLTENLSSISDVFSFVYTPLPVPIRYFKENLSSIAAKFSRVTNYKRTFRQVILVSDVFRRFIEFPRRLVQNLSFLKVVFVRRVNFLRRLIENLSVLKTVFTRKLSFLRRFVENLSVLKDVFSFVYVPVLKVYRLVQTIFIQALVIRRVSYLRKLVDSTFIQDVFSYIYTPLIRVYRFIQTIVMSTLIRRKVSLVRSVRQNLSVLQDLFSSVYTPVIRVYRFIQNLSSISHVFRFEVITSVEEVLRRKFVQAQSELQDLYEKAKKKAKFYLGR